MVVSSQVIGVMRAARSARPLHSSSQPRCNSACSSPKQHSLTGSAVVSGPPQCSQTRGVPPKPPFATVTTTQCPSLLDFLHFPTVTSGSDVTVGKSPLVPISSAL